MRRMELGQVIDYIIEYNEAHDIDLEEKKPTRRKATQADWDAFLG